MLRRRSNRGSLTSRTPLLSPSSARCVDLGRQEKSQEFEESSKKLSKKKLVQTPPTRDSPTRDSVAGAVRRFSSGMAMGLTKTSVHGLVNNHDEYGTTALMLSAQYGDVLTVKLLLEHHASTAAQSLDGTTALMMAARDGRAFTCEVLIDAHKLADVYLLPPLKAYCLHALDAALTAENCQQALLIAHGRGLPEAKTVCLRFVVDNHEETFEAMDELIGANEPALLKEVFAVTKVHLMEGETVQLGDHQNQDHF